MDNINQEKEIKNKFQVRNGGRQMFILLFILIIGIPLLKENIENQQYREQCRRRGDSTYWSNTGLRYTNTDQKVYK